MLGKKLIQAATGAAGGGGGLGIEDVFSTWLYTGNGSTQTITNGIDLDGEGGLVWIKRRDASGSNYIFDSAQSAFAAYLVSNDTSAAVSFTPPNWVTATTTGFNLDSNWGTAVNGSGQSMASWTFRKAEKFFDVVTYTGTGGSRTVAHNLGSVPGCIIVKRVNTSGTWYVYHSGLPTPETDFLVFNQTNAAGSSSNFFGSLATSTHFTVNEFLNNSGDTYVAYLFAHDAGGFGDSGDESVIKCGSYIGTGSNQLINLGWEPQWLMVKRASTTTGNANQDSWHIINNMTGITATVNANSPSLKANTAEPENIQGGWGSLDAQGFYTGADVQNNGQTFIYIAIRRGPMKTPTDATEVFSATTRTGTSSTTIISSLSFPTDATLIKTRTASLGYDWNLFDRLRGATKKLATNSTNSESTETNNLNNYASMTGYTLGLAAEVNSSSDNFVDFNFRRAPGFFDVVAYTGTGVARTVNHNLGVEPELMIVKSRSAAIAWAVYTQSLNATQGLQLQQNIAAFSSTAYWNNTAPTASLFTAGTTLSQSSTTYITYLFATLPGISKVGSYTGTGTTLNIDCGFAAGARFVLIKRTDDVGDWYVWDSARGIVAGNDPYLLINTTAAEVTSTDYIDPLASGFQITSSAPAAINASGGSYIFLAIA